ncbi:MAG: thioredoxin domain-containing protein [Candidatus Omnitrophica bacterium]|nr:thioredoxin domain-containing protein [Candidatus Omnitrophota bacterium]
MTNNSNHLIDEKSPYLLQHAHNPVDWYPWGQAAFDKAKHENKPVLLSIGYSTCHWCHVMAHESFEDETVAQIINDHFVAVKVDREERPDIDHIYMTAVTAMTAQGGWPLTVFLTPQGEPFYGGTYFPPYAKWGSTGFIDLLHSIAAAWDKDRGNILSSGRSIVDELRRRVSVVSSGAVADKILLDRAFEQMKNQFDALNGGFGAAPKFPMGHNLSFLLRYGKSTRTPEALDMAGKTLTAVAHGGIGDHLGGGFHRYSTDPHWHLPHFEKMLYDQALLSRAYLEGYQATGSAEYAKTAREVLDYVLRDMTDEGGGFYSAEDADSLQEGHLKEGAFYVFTQAEIVEALGRDGAEVFNYCYGVEPDGNARFDPHGEFKGKNILYLAHSIPEAADKFHGHSDEIQSMLMEGRQKLWALRNRRGHRPHRDDKILCDWNGLMMASFALAGRVLNEPRYARAASRAADFILTHLMTAGCAQEPCGRLLHRWRDGQAGITATLDDYAFLIYGLLEVYEAAFDEKYLGTARHLADEMIRLFADDAGGFFMTAVDAEALIMRPKDMYDGALPSGNSVAALDLLKLYALNGGEIYNSRARDLFTCAQPLLSQTPWAYSFLLSALGWYLEGPLEITFQGRRNDTTIAGMLEILYKYFIPYKVVKYVSDQSRPPQALICCRGACRPPVNSIDAFEELICLFK